MNYFKAFQFLLINIMRPQSFQGDDPISLTGKSMTIISHGPLELREFPQLSSSFDDFSSNKGSVVERTLKREDLNLSQGFYSKSNFQVYRDLN